VIIRRAYLATGPYALVYGENPDTAPAASPGMDLGYTTLPGVDFMSKVVTLEKTSDPVIVETTSGSTANYSLMADTYSFALSGINIIDTLSGGWAYVDDSTIHHPCGSDDDHRQCGRSRNLWHRHHC